ncbi:GntR family transcriptional regulator [Enteractinococcus coprophilus]|uniref:GntR family transcriptional regulator n=1 Tax=Enteractinococcus coprophilus TaxID=1027633 RepID=A0A543AIT2_9MICC|nr:GntR family transcriptional regulator [Enteractinococcus coprophilus]TQL72484.1 GntR family transcriptional regulator [Enteractinococcus coprophilus]
MGEARPPVHRTLAERAYDQLRDLIISAELAPGQLIDEERMIERLGIGRTPLREAMRRLRAEGLLDIYPHRGTFVPEVTVRDLRQISEARRVLEGYAAARAAQSTSDIFRKDLVEAYEELQTIEDADAERLLDIDARMHEAIYRAMDNRYIESTLKQYFTLSQRMWNYVLPRLQVMRPHVDEHLEMLQAVIQQKPGEAEQLAISHVTNFEKAVLEAL